MTRVYIVYGCFRNVSKIVNVRVKTVW